MRPGGGGGELGFLSQKPVCNRKEIPLAVLQWRIGIQRSASEIQLLEVHSSVLPADPACPLSAGGLYSVGNYLNVWTGGDPILLFAAPLLFPRPLSPEPWKQLDLANVIWELALQAWQGAVTIMGFCRLRLSYFDVCKTLLLPIPD